ncbi:hypothetical protein [Nocardia pseudobrasiliensis]|uniref:Secreted protein n=1 Tax=Nocardia pseudobrasiliensis TaxID=45979 RepID=A0A370HSX8_9NOCA|nr:hypothetical protein [Nocardia pseudobrasiliensis]RDI61627.1 hypothetical protein DFR76_113128 [Nocardia pseudobrasiliensis]
MLSLSKTPRPAARLAVAAALVALPLAAVAAPALADDTVPSATQITGHHHHHHRHHHHGNGPWQGDGTAPAWQGGALPPTGSFG